jgi:hypothetical protein
MQAARREPAADRADGQLLTEGAFPLLRAAITAVAAADGASTDQRFGYGLGIMITGLRGAGNSRSAQLWSAARRPGRRSRGQAVEDGLDIKQALDLGARSACVMGWVASPRTAGLGLSAWTGSARTQRA